MSPAGRNVTLEMMKSFTVDEVGNWLCQIGFNDYTAKFVDGDVNGQKLVNLQTFQLNYFFGNDKIRERQFWQLLQSVVHKRVRTAPPLPSRAMFGKSNFPKLPMGRRPPPKPQAGGYPPHHTPAFSALALNPQQSDDEFSDDDDEHYLMEVQVESYPVHANQIENNMKPGAANRPQPPVPPTGATGSFANHPFPGAPPRRPVKPKELAPDPEDNYLIFDPPEEAQIPSSGFPKPMHPPRRQSHSDRPLMPLPAFDAPRQPIPHEHPNFPPQDSFPKRPPPMPPAKFIHHGTRYHGINGGESTGSSPTSSHNPSRETSLTKNLPSSRNPSREPSLNSISHAPYRNNSGGSTSSSTSDEDRHKTYQQKNAARPQDFPKKNPFPGTKHFSRFPMPPHEAAVEDQAWYKDIDRHNAQELVEYKEPGTFIVRPRTSDNEPYALTLWGPKDKIYNFKIRKREDRKYALGTEKGGEKTFTTVMDLVDHHMKYNVILEKGEGEVLLVPYKE